MAACSQPIRYPVQREANSETLNQHSASLSYTLHRTLPPWAGEPPPAAFYRFTPDRRGKWPKDHLAGFKGFLHADGYAGFEELYRSGDIREVACMAHIRRKFFDLYASQGSAIAEEALARIQKLYEVEAEARGRPPGRRKAIRQAKARALFDDLEAWLKVQLTRISAKSTLAGAIRYALTRMTRLRGYLDHGILELDNNTAERSMRAIALGRKNYLFMGSERGGKSAAIAYTLIETAKLNGVDPQPWLTDVLARIADHKITRLSELMPWSHTRQSRVWRQPHSALDGADRTRSKNGEQRTKVLPRGT